MDAISRNKLSLYIPLCVFLLALKLASTSQPIEFNIDYLFHDSAVIFEALEQNALKMQGLRAHVRPLGTRGLTGQHISWTNKTGILKAGRLTL